MIIIILAFCIVAIATGTLFLGWWFPVIWLGCALLSAGMFWMWYKFMKRRIK